MKVILLGESFKEGVHKQVAKWCRAAGLEFLFLPNLLSLIEKVDYSYTATILIIDLEVIGPGQKPRDVIKFLIAEKGLANLAVIPVSRNLHSEAAIELFRLGVVDVISDSADENSFFIAMARGLQQLKRPFAHPDHYDRFYESIQAHQGVQSSGHAPQIWQVFDFFKSEPCVQGVNRLEYVWPILLELMREDEPVPISNLAIASGAPLSTVTRIVKSLSQKEIVVVTPDRRDKRRTLVEISCDVKERIINKFYKEVLS